MPEVNVTSTLSSTIKQYRKEVKMRGDALSRELNKNTSFISQLETGKISEISTDLLYDIFNILLDKESKDSNTEINKHEKITSILDTLQLTLSNKELELQQWMRTMDLQYRMIPIPESIISYLNNKIQDYKIDTRALITKINLNEPLYKRYEKEKIDLLESNKVYCEISEHNRSMYVKFNLEESFIDDILSKKIVKCNYVSLQIIIMNILLLEGISEEETYDVAQQLLLEKKFYTMLDKQNIESKNAIEKLAPHDLQFRKVLKEIDELLIDINDRQPSFLNNILATFNNNIQTNPSLTLSVISKDLTDLKDMSSDNKKSFIQEYKDLIYRYKTSSVDDTPKIETF